MEQTRLGSLIEAIINIAIGFSINFTANMVLFPLLGWEISVQQNIALGACYTAISIARSYCVRRWFNARLHRAVQTLANKVCLSADRTLNMNNFICEKCGTPVIDSPRGYASGCEHYPPDLKPLRGFGLSFDLQSGVSRKWFVDEFGTKRWLDSKSVCSG